MNKIKILVGHVYFGLKLSSLAIAETEKRRVTEQRSRSLLSALTEEIGCASNCNVEENKANQHSQCLSPKCVCSITIREPGHVRPFPHH